ncbi:uncharacterized protein LOC124416256 [Diprion similis]|uniref:uncharacterized protein LOC124416256 n=1 Tax=Diprion similis TaxID=362088 RepID=UPI001EF7EC61|nr:uncharacterized protein LOC124416256 [Diprion similis]
MQPLFIVLCLATVCEFVRTERIVTGHLIEDFFQQKYVHQVTVFACWNNFEAAAFNRDLMNSGIKTGFVYVPNRNLNMRQILTVNYYKLGVVLDLDCPGSHLVLDQFTEQNIPFNESYSWLLVTNETMPRTLLSTLPLTIETELVVALLVADDTFELYDVYNPSYRHGGDLNVTYMGKWNIQQGLTVNLTQYKYQRRGDLRGLSLNVSIAITHTPAPDFMTYISYPINRHLDTMHRFNYALVCQLRDSYNFKMNLMRATSWGYLLDNGSFNGMLGDMIAGRVDIGATPLQFKEERIDVAEFTVQTWLARPCFIFRHPKKSTVRNGFLRPFAPDVWMLTMLTALVCWFLLYIIVKVEPRLTHRAAKTTLDIHAASETALIVAASLCQQGLTDGPQLISGRVVFIFLFIWGLLLYQFYSASIVGSLLAQHPRYINTLKDLLDSDLRVGIEDIAYNYDFFATTTDPVALRLYKKKVAPARNRKQPAYYSPREGLRRVQKGGFAFHVDVATAYKIITDTFAEDEICDLVEIQLFPPKHTATVTSKHSPFKKMVTYGMRKIIERGMAERLRHVWHYRKPICPESHSAIPVPVSLEEFSPALFLLSMGMTLAGALVYVEKYAKRQNALKKKRHFFVTLSSMEDRRSCRKCLVEVFRKPQGTFNSRFQNLFDCREVVLLTLDLTSNTKVKLIKFIPDKWFLLLEDMHLSIFLTFALLLAGVTASIDRNELSNLIIDYVNYKNASRLISAFLCLRDLGKNIDFSIHNSVSLSRRIMNASISAAIFNSLKICDDKEPLENLLRYNYHSINIITDLDCDRSKELLIGISAGNMFNYSYSWLLTSNNKSDALEFMEGLNLSVDTDVVLAITAEETVRLYDIFNTGSDRNGTLNATFIGTWRSLSPRLNIIKLQSPVYRRQNLTGITLKFAAVTMYMDPKEDDPIKYLSNPANRTYDAISKVNYALGVIPRDFFNYSVEVSTWSDFGGRWNGTPFFGMMGALGRREADFTLGGTVMTQERLEYCTPIVQNYPFWTGFLFKHPASHSVRNVFLEPLSPSSWNAVVVLSLLVIVIMSIASRYHRKEYENPWSFGIYSTLATLFQQGWHSSLPGHSGHILFVVFTLFSMLLYNFYSASVVSSLLSDPPQNIRTIGDLLNFGMPSAYENASYVPHYFKISTVSSERMFYEKKLLDKGKPKILPRSEGIRRVKEGGFAYHTTPADAYEEIAHEFAQPEICSLAEIPFIKKSVLAMWASRENPYREHLKIIHRRLEEVGILVREHRRWFAPKPECLGSTAVLNSITLNDVAPAFLGLLCGIFAAVFIFALELAHHSLEEKSQASRRHRRKKIQSWKTTRSNHG